MENRRNGVISIGELNVNSLNQRRNELDLILKENNLDVMLINDTRMNDASNAVFNNYNLERTDHPSNSRMPGGVLILVKKKLSYDRVKIDVKESVAIDLKYGARRVRICTTYLHPGEWLNPELMT